MERNFTYLTREKIEKRFEEIERNFEIQRIMAEFIQEMAKKGHKKINKRIKIEMENFLTERKIDYRYVYYCNDSNKYGESTFYDIKLSVSFEDYDGFSNRLIIMSGFDCDKSQGFYDNLIEKNKWADLELIEKIEKEYLENYKNAVENFKEYNKKLQELISMKESFGTYADF